MSLPIFSHTPPPPTSLPLFCVSCSSSTRAYQYLTWRSPCLIPLCYRFQSSNCATPPSYLHHDTYHHSTTRQLVSEHQIYYCYHPLTKIAFKWALICPKQLHQYSTTTEAHCKLDIQDLQLFQLRPPSYNHPEIPSPPWKDHLQDSLKLRRPVTSLWVHHQSFSDLRTDTFHQHRLQAVSVQSSFCHP